MQNAPAAQVEQANRPCCQYPGPHPQQPGQCDGPRLLRDAELLRLKANAGRTDCGTDSRHSRVATDGRSRADVPVAWEVNRHRRSRRSRLPAAHRVALESESVTRFGPDDGESPRTPSAWTISLVPSLPCAKSCSSCGSFYSHRRNAHLGQTPCRNNMCAPTLIDLPIGTSGRTSGWCRRRFYKPNCSFAVQIVAKVSTRPNKQGPQVVESIDAQMRASNVLGAGGRAFKSPRPDHS